MKLKKISVKNFIETLTDNELKNVVGGYDYGGCMEIVCSLNGYYVRMTTSSNECWYLAEMMCDGDASFVCRGC